MSSNWINTKSGLLEHIERDWATLNSLLSTLSEKQWTEIKNEDGWTVKDHVIHIAIWEDSVIAFLRHVPRHEGLGISEELYLDGGIDAVNLAIFKQHKDKPLAEVEAQFRRTHTELMSLIHELSNEDLNLPYSHYLPDDEEDETGPPAINIVYGSTAFHYREHVEWIEEMLEDDAD